MVVRSIMKKKLLLHSCCAPCLTAVYERLAPQYDIVVFWYNPNIWPQEEHDKRLKELTRFCKTIGAPLLIGKYDYQEEHTYWSGLAGGLENEPERGKRCKTCYEMRLAATAYTALELNSHGHAAPFDYFTTELSVSPHKNADWLNEIGVKLEKELNIKYLASDFKKGGGFARSVELSHKHNLYRQNYCGCKYSVR